MTLKEFAKKYELPYSIVYNASYLVKPINKRYEYHNNQYSEEELAKSIMLDLKRKKNNLEKKLDVVNLHIRRIGYHFCVDKNCKK